jgi:hypothetical protein
LPGAQILPLAGGQQLALSGDQTLPLTGAQTKPLPVQALLLLGAQILTPQTLTPLQRIQPLPITGNQKLILPTT